MTRSAQEKICPADEAIRNSGGLVLAQVSELLPRPAALQRVRVPGIRQVRSMPEDVFAGSGKIAP